MAMQEYCEDCPDQQRTVARCADLSDAVLPVTLQQQAGDRIYAGLQSGFRVRACVVAPGVVQIIGMLQ